VARVIKQPISLGNLNFADLRLLSVYLCLKSQAIDGKLSKCQIRQFNYWKQKLLFRGLIKLDRSEKYYLIRSYQATWEIFGIMETVSSNGKHKRVFCRKIEHDNVKDILKALYEHKAQTLANQIRYARTAGRKTTVNILAPLSARTVSKLFGYKQPCTGSRKRKQLFNLVNEPLKRVMVYIPAVNPHRLVSRFETRTVIL
jgi:hypothetical protein